MGVKLGLSTQGRMWIEGHENIVPRMIFGTKREKLRINELHNLRSSPNNIRMIK
jgi:hypothetical protein